jgi:hypothetical protein
VKNEKQIQFKSLIDAPKKASFKKQQRIDRYKDRLFDMSFSSSISKPLFCTECKSLTCNNSEHPHIELHPIVRIPRKNASKQRWKEFENAFRKYH